MHAYVFCCWTIYAIFSGCLACAEGHGLSAARSGERDRTTECAAYVRSVLESDALAHFDEVGVPFYVFFFFYFAADRIVVSWV